MIVSMRLRRCGTPTYGSPHGRRRWRVRWRKGCLRLKRQADALETVQTARRYAAIQEGLDSAVSALREIAEELFEDDRWRVSSAAEVASVQDRTPEMAGTIERERVCWGLCQAMQGAHRRSPDAAVCARQCRRPGVCRVGGSSTNHAPGELSMNTFLCQPQPHRCHHVLHVSRSSHEGRRSRMTCVATAIVPGWTA
jgi:hypothetical protein